MIFERVDVQQGTEEWLNLRYNYITASDIVVLFGFHDYKTPLQLAEEKIFRKKEPITKEKQELFNKGHDAEESIRVYMKNTYGIEFTPAVLISKKCPALMASLDGISPDCKTIMEAKYTGRANVQNTIETGVPPKHHYTQMQTQLFVSGAEKCIYYALEPTGKAVFCDVLPDLKMHDDIAVKATQFLKDIKAHKFPEPCEKDYVVFDSPIFARLAELKRAADSASDLFEKAKSDVLKNYIQHRRIKANGLRIVTFTKQGNVDYSAIPQLKGVNLDQYRKKPVTSTRISYDIQKNGPDNGKPKADSEGPGEQVPEV